MAVTAQIGAAAAKTRKTQNRARCKKAGVFASCAARGKANAAKRLPAERNPFGGEPFFTYVLSRAKRGALQLPHSMEIELKSARRSSTLCAAFASPAASNTMCPLSNMHSRVP